MGACSSSAPAAQATSAATTATATPTAAASTPSAGAQPETAAAAAAARFFGLYSASQYGAAWSLLDPADRKAIPQATWIAVHDGCRAPSAGLAYQITDVTVTGATAVVTYTLSGALSKLGSATQAFVYSGGPVVARVQRPPHLPARQREGRHRGG